MNDKPYNPFENIDVSDFIPDVSSTSTPNKQEVRAAAELAGFTSREPVPPKSKAITKTAALFEKEIEIIDRCKAVFADGDGSFKPSDSDIMRAALHIFNTIESEEIIKMLTLHRGRGRK